MKRISETVLLTSVKSLRELTAIINEAHPAGLPKSPDAKFDPAIQKIQYELREKGYMVRTDGILDDETQQAYDWDKGNATRDASIQDYPALQSTMNEPITAPTAPIDNPQGGFDRMPEINEHVSFTQEDSLARIIQLARG